jgi:hypothetical protein
MIHIPPPKLPTFRAESPTAAGQYRFGPRQMLVRTPSVLSRTPLEATVRECSGSSSDANAKGLMSCTTLGTHAGQW